MFYYEMVRAAILAAGTPNLSSNGWRSLTCSRPSSMHGEDHLIDSTHHN